MKGIFPPSVFWYINSFWSFPSSLLSGEFSFAALSYIADKAFNWLFLLLTVGFPCGHPAILKGSFKKINVFSLLSPTRFLSVVGSPLLQPCLGTAWRCYWRGGRPTARVAAVVSVSYDSRHKQWRICLSAPGGVDKVSRFIFGSRNKPKI